MAPESNRAKLYLLKDRLSGLQAMVRERFRTARAAGSEANVKALSATIRKVKRDILLLTAKLERKNNGNTKATIG